MPLTAKSKATLRTLSSSLLYTLPYHLTPLAFINPFTISLNTSMSICTPLVFLSTTFQPPIAYIIALPVFYKIAMSCSFKHLFSLPYSISDLTQKRRIFSFIFNGRPLPRNTRNFPNSRYFMQAIFHLAVTAVSPPPLAFRLSPK